MASRLSLLVLLLVAAAASATLTSTAAQLQYGYYNTTCPGVEDLVREELLTMFAADMTLPAGLLRLQFHDCFGAGCDATLLLKSHNGTAQRDADPNSTVRGYEAIEAVKAKVEAACPLVVSCADLLAMAARDAINFTQGPAYQVETGRRDGNVSRKEDAERFLPPADGNVTVLTQYFAAQNLSAKDMIVLSAAHTIGAAHCPSFSKRLYNSSGAGDQDPAMDPAYAKNLTAACPAGNVASVQPLDPVSPNRFDLGYYKSVANRTALLGSDAALLEDSLSFAYVQLMTNDSYLDTFFADFAASMINMGRIGVRTGADGEIRDTCAVYVD
ncbi:hypothetical protein C2845_PM04G00840 [Panicum miliaceum]|uniref:Peroxidase n=1 Tax=Panicum miliaceum TaxID=4540 RepID=A0A3L6QSU7_PANMI|nr:hypothetical protein C2845_PM04G00840 [Panicum miliaceum]